ncbi:MAG: protein phosphatase 2C domain-containing protein [Gemmatimonadaceae bacterium]|nr:protein phosphatase 2C domain-containing protein [Gemmatimonadaceae bacterium]
MSVLPNPPRRPRDDEIDVCGLSHAGKVRRENQDHFLIANIHQRMQVLSSNLVNDGESLPDHPQRLALLAMIADGVGGGVGGAEASAIALQATMRYVESSLTAYYGSADGQGEFTALLQAAAQRAHEAVRAHRDDRGVAGTMATTLTMYFAVWPWYYLLQVGDSRYYVWRDGVLRQMTRDQTMAQDLVESGVLSEADAARTPLAHVLSSAIGADKSMPVVTKHAFDWNNRHLLCSDGLTKHVTDARIGEILATMTSAKQAAEQLLQEALDGGGSDNITIIVGKSTPRDA